jgi:xylobiose transport system permease protein
VTALTTSAPPARARSRRRGRRGGSDSAPRPNMLYVLPALLFFAAFAMLPVVGVAVLSFTKWNNLGAPKFIGLANWTRLLQDDLVLSSLSTTLLLTVLSWAIQTVLAMSLGVWAAGRQRNRAALSAVFFLPLLLSSAAIALLWKSMLDPNFGLAGRLGKYVGFPDGNIIGTPRGALFCIVLTVAWQFVPFHMLMYQAGARNIPAQLYEAATIDGANRWQMFRRITLPQLRNTIITSSTLMIVGSLTFFETILLLTNGGPGDATFVLPYLMYYQGFRQYQLGFAATIATVLVFLGTVLSLLIVRFSGFARMRSTLEGM